MSSNSKSKNFIEKVQVHFNYLITDYGYKMIEIQENDIDDKITYLNKDLDRQLTLYNSYHPADYGFEAQWFRPSISTNHSDREFQLYVLQENQDIEQEYLAKIAERLRSQFEGIIKGTNWISTKL
ncbi:hypothetical protein GCM10023115_24880 [Pontixanthobacter gangjinensis]|uniref:Uncharacterized protein n=1 Tax=Christiangramia aestuarii TaxID=1028746 RepID=A0A7K1LST4_9FLAO|nr:hypothetical protein [Christiangramia aestuarii]MUP43879.1 hypothetical protein [Christiangramia aestuarii]